tara:strand:- start:27 stop:236 length:210 start_codon:yes stop_codon:yes gene_type:complete
VKKDNQIANPLIQKNKSSRYLSTDKVKTTNVNILLNRVRLDRKKTLKKRIIFTFALISLVCALAFYFTI